MVGRMVGTCDGLLDGFALGTLDGRIVKVADGALVGRSEGRIVGWSDERQLEYLRAYGMDLHSEYLMGEQLEHEMVHLMAE